MKVYLPSPGGAWRMVFEITRDRTSGELVLTFLAFGAGHPGKPWQPSAYVPARPKPEQSQRRLTSGEFTVISERDGDVHRVLLIGELDLATVAEVDRELLRVESTDARLIILDLSGLTFIGSTGVQLLMAAQARSRADSNGLGCCADPEPSSGSWKTPRPRRPPAVRCADRGGRSRRVR